MLSEPVIHCGPQKPPAQPAGQAQLQPPVPILVLSSFESVQTPFVHGSSVDGRPSLTYLSRQSSESVVQSSPSQPVGHVQAQASGAINSSLPDSLHSPALAQGEEVHSSVSSSQSCPEKPLMQSHRNSFMGISYKLVDWSVQVPPLIPVARNAVRHDDC